MNHADRKNLRKILKKYIPPQARILDVGCGTGENISLLNAIGYTSVVGVDISPEMVSKARERGHAAYVSGEMPETTFDVVLFSHVIEHLGYPDVVMFLEEYFSKAIHGAKIIIITPTLYDAFYNDIDHIKPYYPDGLITLFSTNHQSRQYSSKFTLKLLDIYFRRAPLVPYNLRSRYIKDLKNKIAFMSIRYSMIALKLVTFNLMSKVTGQAVIFELATCSEDQEQTQNQCR